MLFLAGGKKRGKKEEEEGKKRRAMANVSLASRLVIFFSLLFFFFFSPPRFSLPLFLGSNGIFQPFDSRCSSMVGKKGWRKGKREKSFSISFPSLSLSSRVSSFVTRFRDFISNRVDKRIVLER